MSSMYCNLGYYNLSCMYKYAFFNKHIIIFYDVDTRQLLIVYHVEWSMIGK